MVVSRIISIFATQNRTIHPIFKEMTIQEFTDIFLPTLSSKYMNGELALYSLVDIDTWSKVFPDSQNESKDFLWYQIKLNSFYLKDNSGLIVYSLPEPNRAGERKFIGIRFDNKKHKVNYYILQRPRFYDSTWEIYQYSFASNKYIFECVINGTHSLRDFVNTINHRKAEVPKGFIETLKDTFLNSLQMQQG